MCRGESHRFITMIVIRQKQSCRLFPLYSTYLCLCVPLGPLHLDALLLSRYDTASADCSSKNQGSRTCANARQIALGIEWGRWTSNSVAAGADDGTTYVFAYDGCAQKGRPRRDIALKVDEKARSPPTASILCENEAIIAMSHGQWSNTLV